MSRLTATSIILVALSGCMEVPATTEDVSHTYTMPEGMEGCKVFKLISTTGNDLYVVRCPMNTSTKELGKSTIETNVTTPNIL